MKSLVPINVVSRQPSQPVVLNSWKEISSYIGRGIRTVQRWEENFGLPVHRPAGHSRSAVLAFPDEIDAWLRRASMERGCPNLVILAEKLLDGLRTSNHPAPQALLLGLSEFLESAEGIPYKAQGMADGRDHQAPNCPEPQLAQAS